MSEMYPATTVCRGCGAVVAWHRTRRTGEMVLVDPRTGLPHHETCPARVHRATATQVVPRDTYRPYPGPFREDADD